MGAVLVGLIAFAALCWLGDRKVSPFLCIVLIVMVLVAALSAGARG